MGRVGTIHYSHDSDWKDGFLFVGNHLALDFLNTRPIQDGKTIELLPDFGALLRWFQAANLLSSHEAWSLWRAWNESVRGRRTVAAVQQLREGLRKEVCVWERGDIVRRATIDELNRLMAEHPVLTRLAADGNALSARLWFVSRRPEDLLAPLVHSVAMLFVHVDRNRVRKCDQCVLHFYDTSKKGTRRWCSMRLCGNRFKVAAYAARQRMRVHNSAFRSQPASHH